MANQICKQNKGRMFLKVRKYAEEKMTAIKQNDDIKEKQQTKDKQTKDNMSSTNICQVEPAKNSSSQRLNQKNLSVKSRHEGQQRNSADASVSNGGFKKDSDFSDEDESEGSIDDFVRKNALNPVRNF